MIKILICLILLYANVFAQLDFPVTIMYGGGVTAAPDTSFELSDSTGFAAGSIDFGSDTSKTYNVTAVNTTWNVVLTDSTEASLTKNSSSFTVTYTPTTEGAYDDSIHVTNSYSGDLYLAVSGTGVDTASAPEETNILTQDSSFVYGNWNAANAVWWEGNAYISHNPTEHRYEYNAAGAAATLITEPTYGSTWSIEVADQDNWEVGFGISGAASGLYMMIDLYEASFTNRQNLLGSNFTYYLKANGVHWVDFTRTTKADKIVISFTNSSGGAGNIDWIKIRPK